MASEKVLFVREVSFVKKGVTSSGLFAVIDSEAEERALALHAIEDGINFHANLDLETIKTSAKVPEGQDPFDFVIGLFDHDSIKFELLEDSVRVSVSNKLKSGLTRKLWSATLERDDSSGHTFILRLVQAKEKVAEEEQNMQSESDEAIEAMNEWKDTAEKLEQGWEKERQELLQKFLVLYNKQHDLLEKAREEAKGLQADVESLSQQMATLKSKKRTAATLDQVPDDQDRVLYDEETVKKLSGRGTTGKTTKRKAPAAASKAASTKKVKKAKNNTTGATEYYDVDAVFEDDEGTDEGTTSKRRAKRKPAAMAKVKDEPNDSDNEETEFVDKSMQDDIMAQLAAMKETED